MRVKRQLVLGIGRREFPVGRPVTVRVRDESNRPVEGATVEVGTQRTRTDERGLCEITLRSPGFWKLVARKPPTDRVAYESTTGLVRALPRSTVAGSTRRAEIRRP